MDDYLVQSIVQPTSDPNAGEVYYRYLFLCFAAIHLLSVVTEGS